MNNFIKLDDLYDAQARRNREKEKLYDDFLTACTNKIKKCASVYKQYNCIYEIPPFKVGHPQYNALDLKKYIIKKLTLNGFYVREESGLTIYVSWKPEDFNYEAYHKYLNYLNKKYDKKLNQRLITQGSDHLQGVSGGRGNGSIIGSRSSGGIGSGSGSGSGGGSGGGGSSKNKKSVENNTIGLLTYGNKNAPDAVPVNLKQFEKNKLKR